MKQILQTRRNEEGRKNLNEKKSHLSLFIYVFLFPSFLLFACTEGPSFFPHSFCLGAHWISDRDTCPVFRPTPWNNPNNQQSNRSKSFTQKEH